MKGLRLVVSSAAREDLTSMYQFGVEHFGSLSAERYLEHFKTAFRQLSHYPEIGLQRPELFFGMRSFVVSSHIVFYQLHLLSETKEEKDWVEIVRILHTKQDPICWMNHSD